MFNSTEKFLFRPSADARMNGVVLPHSDKVLNLQALDKKIEGARNHITHLASQLSHRNTHGGKTFRARKHSLQDLISNTSKRLELLQIAKAAILKPPVTRERIPAILSSVDTIVNSLSDKRPLGRKASRKRTAILKDLVSNTSNQLTRITNACPVS